MKRAIKSCSILMLSIQGWATLDAYSGVFHTDDIIENRSKTLHVWLELIRSARATSNDSSD
jgi:hypothetical protein